MTYIDTPMGNARPNARGVATPIIIRSWDIDRHDVYVGWRVNAKPYKTFEGARSRAIRESTR